MMIGIVIAYLLFGLLQGIQLEREDRNRKLIWGLPNQPPAVVFAAIAVFSVAWLPLLIVYYLSED